MSTRQNKKRKAKPNRERTVTTLTGADDQVTHRPSQNSFLVPTTPDDSAGPSNPMSSPFSVASSSGGPTVGANNTNSVPHTNFQIPASYSAFPYGSFTTPIHPSQQQHPQQNPFYPSQALPPGQSDLELLERLKETIKNNQHEIFRAFPQPAALASLYKGPIQATQTPLPPHPDQLPLSGYQTVAYPQSGAETARPHTSTTQSPDGPPGLSASSSADLGPRIASISWDAPRATGHHRKSSLSSPNVGGPPPNNINVLPILLPL
ncbi:hypothetical protein BV25DRAFT_1191972 [Artomyces pyxidatus]|uniref:Uncharacterized protein n=1 Tax=Artomyces pyxidatus TaxID=48021 RepID=A0ACB8SS52_9AGAM|nr:hypothetical protein BV25DRAFT_1191972 [Artomyces pyxidatus]